jgi:hypothetical protein
MKMLPIAGVVFLGLLSVSEAWAKTKPVDFSAFKGNYSGTVLVNVSGASSFGGPASINFNVPKNGKSARVTINAFVSTGGSSVPVNGVLDLTRTTFTSSDILLHFISTTGPVTVPSRLSKAGVSAFGASSFQGTSFTLQATAKVRPRGTKRKALVLTYVIAGSGFSYTYQFTATAKVKK